MFTHGWSILGKCGNLSWQTPMSATDSSPPPTHPQSFNLYSPLFQRFTTNASVRREVQPSTDPLDSVQLRMSISPFLGEFSSVQSLSRVRLFVTPWTAARQASLSITKSWSPPKLMSITSVMPSNHLILCHPRFLLPSILPGTRIFSNESVLHLRWPKYWSFSFNISPSNEYSGLISLGLIGWISLQSKGLSRVLSNTTVQKHQFLGVQLSLQSNSHIHT